MRRFTISTALALALCGAASAGEITVPLPDQVSATDAERLSVVVNGIDHTAFAVIEDGRLVISDEPASFQDTNDVRLFLETETAFQEIGVWTVPYQVEDSLAATGSVSGTAVVVATEDGMHRFGGVGGDIKASARHGAWTWELDAVAEASLTEASETERLTSLKAGLLARRRGQTSTQTIRLGDQTLGADSLVLPPAERRGASFVLDHAGLPATVSTFAFVNRVIGEDDVRYERGFTGGSIAFEPADGVTVEAIATLGDVRRFKDAPRQRGVTGGARFTWESQDGASQAGAELALADQDVDGMGGGTGHAVSAWFGHETVFVLADETLTMTIEGRYSQVSRDFFAFGAPNLATDARQAEVSAAMGTERLTVSLTLAAYEDNIARDPAFAVNQGLETALDVTYVVAPGWTLSSGIGTSFARVKDSPDAQEPDSSGLALRGYGGVAYQGETFSVASTHVLSHTGGNGVFAQDVLTYQTDLSGTWTPVAGLDLTVYAQMQAQFDSDAPDSVTANLGASAEWALTDSLNLALSIDGAMADQPDFAGSDARIGLGWAVHNTATLTLFAGYSGGSLAPSAPFAGGYAGLSLSLDQPFSL